MEGELIECLRILKIEKDITLITKSEVNVAFKTLAKICHPDKSGNNATTSNF